MSEHRLKRTREVYDEDDFQKCTCYPWEGIHATDCPKSSLTKKADKAKVDNSARKVEKNGTRKPERS